MKLVKLTIAGLAASSLTACIEGTRAYQGPNDFIAVAGDLGRDSDGNFNDNAAVAVTPDGCQAWVIDDGLEGRASNRLDPISGLPVCAGEPGVVYGPYQSGSPGIADRVPGEPVPVTTQQVPVRSTQGHFHQNGEFHTGHSH